jgi:hypothetical protein
MGDDETRETGMWLAHDTLFTFKGHWGYTSRCHIRVWRGRGTLSVVMATELPDNPGTSITNAAERLAAEVWERVLSDAREGFIWIQRYPAGRGASPGSVLDDEKLDQVSLVLGEKRDGVQELELDRSSHPWRRVTRAEVEGMLGQSLPMGPDEI